jgi:2-oxoglutarate/2-oxoacid ferredoxin oxidoreductase subunit beta
MSEPRFPKCVKQESKPSNFCPGCGHSMILKTLGFALDDLKIAGKTVFVTDIGCSLLSWDYFDVDTFQSHHGRAAVTATGVKRALPKSTVIAYMGDGGGYAIGLHHLIHVAKRNESMTVILVNNTVFAMTGGQMAPTTIPGEITETTPSGKFIEEDPFFGPELLAGVVKPGAFVARASVDNLPQVKNYIERAIENQNKNHAFSFVEILSVCPINWKKDAKGSMEYLDDLKNIYKTGVFTDES